MTFETPRPGGTKSLVYVSNADSEDVSVFALDEADGSARLVQSVGVAGTVMPMALAPDRRTLYAAIRSQPYRVVALGIDPATGMLTERGSAPLPDVMTHLSVDRSGRFLFAASYAGSKLSLSPIDDRRVPLAATQIVPTGPKAHQASADPENRYVYAAVLGADRLERYDFDTAKGELIKTEQSAIVLPPGSGPRHFVFAPDAPFMYLLDELDGKLHVLKRTADTGETELLQSVGILPQGFEGKAAAADLRLTPDGRFLYASERTSSLLTGFRVAEETGLLTAIGQWRTETQPRGFNISPSGQYLVAAGQQSHHMTVYRIDRDSGLLSGLARYATGNNPNWIEIVSLPA